MPPWKHIPNFVQAFGLLAGAKMFSIMHLNPRVAGSLFAVSTGGKTIWMRNTPSDMSIFFQIMVKKEYDTGEWPELHARLTREYNSFLKAKRTPIIVDAGANIGLASLWFSALFPEARVYAIEPEERNLAVLRLNVCGFPNIIVLPGAVWDKPAKLGIENSWAGAGAYRVAEGAGQLQSYMISELVSAEDCEPFIVKIDIEGGEQALFRSNTRWLGDTRLTVLELHDWLYPGQGTSKSFLRVISEHNVDFLFRGENIFCFKSD